MALTTPSESSKSSWTNSAVTCYQKISIRVTGPVGSLQRCASSANSLSCRRSSMSLPVARSASLLRARYKEKEMRSHISSTGLRNGKPLSTTLQRTNTLTRTYSSNNLKTSECTRIAISYSASFKNTSKTFEKAVELQKEQDRQKEQEAKCKPCAQLKEAETLGLGLVAVTMCEH